MVSGEFITISNEPEDWTDRDAMSAIEKLNEKEKKQRKQQEKEEEKGKDYAAMFRYAFWHCHPRCGYKVDRRDEGSIQNHMSVCGWQIELREQQAAEKQVRYDALASMRYILHALTRADSEIEFCQKKILEEKTAKLQNWEQAIRYHWERRLNSAKGTKQKELIEKHKMLNHDNEVVREAAQELYKKYLEMTPNQRRSEY
jgi:hypothetical protein